MTTTTSPNAGVPVADEKDAAVNATSSHDERVKRRRVLLNAKTLSASERGRAAYYAEIGPRQAAREAASFSERRYDEDGEYPEGELTCDVGDEDDEDDEEEEDEDVDEDVDEEEDVVEEDENNADPFAFARSMMEMRAEALAVAKLAVTEARALGLDTTDRESEIGRALAREFAAFASDTLKSTSAVVRAAMRL